jgi:peptidoglycan/xylan/chitin deacetylase (PgdA/CDA1 family)
MKRFVKYIACLKGYYYGLVTLFRLLSIRRTPLVLTYHRVVDLSEVGRCLSQAGMVVTTETFEKQIRYLKRSYRVIPLGDLIEQAASGTSTKGLCAITFDDGWRDTYANAYPILRRLGVPATVFLTSGYVGTSRLFWPERLTEVLLRAERKPDDLKRLEQIDAEIAAMTRKVLSSEDHYQRMDALDRLIVALKLRDEATREQVLQSLGVSSARESRGESRERHMLDWNEVGELKQGGFSIGSHTANHAILTQVSTDVAETEVRSSKQEIENRIGEPVTLFAYPNGDWNAEVKRIVQRSEYLSAVVTNNPPDSGAVDRFAIGRVNVHEGTSASPSGRFSKAVFACEISGFLDWLIPGRVRTGY